VKIKPSSKKTQDLVLITGLSGSGKSVALNVLADAGYYCVDNLPCNLFQALIKELQRMDHQRVAVTIDARSGQDVTDLALHIKTLRSQSVNFKIIYLDAKDETLIKRFSETRRRHPLSQDKLTLPECISKERELLAEAAAMANHIDSSDLSPNALRAWVKDFVSVSSEGLTVLFESFGFRYGIPLDADLVFDVRCLANPYYDPILCPLTGQDLPIIHFMKNNPLTEQMIEDIRQFVQKWLPSFERDNRSYLTVAIGCTGGRHRSVYFADTLSGFFSQSHQVLVRHRGLMAL